MIKNPLLYAFLVLVITGAVGVLFGWQYAWVALLGLIVGGAIMAAWLADQFDEMEMRHQARDALRDDVVDELVVALGEADKELDVYDSLRMLVAEQPSMLTLRRWLEEHPPSQRHLEIAADRAS